MFLGSKSSSTIFDVFQVGFTELNRQCGLPEEVYLKTDGCEMRSKSVDMGKRVDVLQVAFPLRPGVEPAQITQAMETARINAHVQVTNGTCALTLPPFEWRQIRQLDPVDQILQDFGRKSVRSLSWEVEVFKYRCNDLNVNRLVEIMKEQRASDLHLRAGSRPYIRVDNDLHPLADQPILTPTDLELLVHQIGSQSEVDKLTAERETSFQFHAAGMGYLRVSGYFKDGAMALAMRLIPENPMSFEELNIPPVVRSITDSHRGLFLVCGITGSGKSSTLAAMVEFINQTRYAHIITTEDPVEYVFKDKKSIISQRQVGRDTFSFANALRGALREDPDVIMVGEMRDTETIRAAISAAETGHLVFSTLHTMSAVDTVNRVISFFPPSERDLIRQQLAYTLRGVVCQRLLKRKGTIGRVPCLEILLGGRPLVRDAILEGEITKLYDIIEVETDMKTFDQYAVDLFQKGIVDKSEALSACVNAESFDRIISGIRSSEGRKLLK